MEDGDGNAKESEASRDEFSMKERSLDDVDDDAILMIIDCFPMKERFRLETMSKRWAELCYTCWSRVKTVEMGCFTDATKHLSVEAAKAVWERCGNRVQEVSFRETNGEEPSSDDGPLRDDGGGAVLEEILADWAEYDPQCKVVDLTKRPVTVGALQWLGRFTKIESLDLTDACVPGPASVNDEALSALMGELGQLKVLNLTGSRTLILECLTDLPDTVESLTIDHCCCEIEEVSVQINLNATLLSAVRPSLKHLRMSGLMAYLWYSPMRFLTILPNLTCLDLPVPDIVSHFGDPSGSLVPRNARTRSVA